MPISINDVAKFYGDMCVIDNISIDIEDGSFVTILGGSGCGKSTLLNMIAGLTSPDKGQVKVDGKLINGPGPDRVVVFQQPSLYPWLTLKNNIAFGLRLSMGSRNINWDKVDELISAVGLSGFEKHYPYELSGGMQQRAAIARAIVMNPRILLMDEPFGALDAITRHNMQKMLLDLWEKIKTTILFVTHDVDEAILLGDRMVVLASRPGRVIVDEEIKLEHPRLIDEVGLHAEFLSLKRQAMKTLESF